MPYLRKCKHCGLEASTGEELINFRTDKSQPHNKQNFCKPCASEYNKKYTRFRKYGITMGDYENMFEEQQGLCGICLTDKPGGRFGTFHIDHNHVTGEVRGLLCQACNTGIGLLKDNPLIIRAAANYVEFWKGGVSFQVA